MGTRTPILLRPHWILNNQLTLPLLAVEADGRTRIRGLMQMFVPITIFLDTLFADNAGFTTRSFDNDQFQIYKSMEGILQTTGIDGKACLLRTICEMQTNPIGEFTVVGEIITILLTPKKGINDFLHDYLEAEQIGQSSNLTCSAAYSDCPVSLYNLFRARAASENVLDDDEDDGEDDYDDDESESSLNLLDEHVTTKEPASGDDEIHPAIHHQSNEHVTAQPLVLQKERLYDAINSIEH